MPPKPCHLAGRQLLDRRLPLFVEKVTELHFLSSHIFKTVLSQVLSEPRSTAFHVAAWHVIPPEQRSLRQLRP